MNIKEIRKTCKKIGEGSSRVVYEHPEYPKDRCIKLAKSERGRLQNSTEVDIANLYPDLVSFVYEYDEEDYNWIVVDKAVRKAVVSDMKEHFKIFKTWKSFFVLLCAFEDGKTNSCLSQMWEHEKCSELLSMIGNYDLAVGDISRRSSWGIMSDGTMRLIDSGATNSIIDEYYS